MKILVTGSNGFLGSALVARLRAGGERAIRCLVRPGSDRGKLEELAGRHAGAIEYCVGTLARPSDCERMLAGVDLVFHLAAATHGAPPDMFANSVVATKNLLEALVAAGRTIKLVHCSSFSVYGVASLPRGGMVDENTPMDPHPEKRDPYSHTKHRQEELVWQYTNVHRIPLVVMRPGVIYGPGSTPMSSRVGVKLFGVFLHLGGKNLIPLTYVENCADAFVVAAQKSSFTGEIYNVVDDNPIDCRQFFSIYRKEIERLPWIPLPFMATRWLSLAVERYSEKSGGQLPAVFSRYKTDSLWKGNAFSNARLAGLGWKQPVPTAEGLRRHFAHMAAQRAD